MTETAASSDSWLADALKAFGLPIIIILLILLALSVIGKWPNVRLFLSDLTSLFGFLGRWLRKVRVVSEFEASINGFAAAFNAEADSKILPECTVRWVKPDQIESYLQQGHAIVCLSFGSGNHDKNFLVGAQHYVASAFLSQAKQFLRERYRKGIDLVLTRKMLTRARRGAISLFNQAFGEEDITTKDAYGIFEELDRKGFFQQLLVPELFAYGEEVLADVPREEHLQETQGFIEWIHNLCGREEHERTEL
ncbi:MAG: hypothetical protein ACRDF4_00050, partial [Rhabdochlamydiaceae bacterium]